MDSNYNSNYYKKYLKYREKYLSLKNQFGGAQCPRCGKDIENCTCKKLENLGDYPISSIAQFLKLDDLLTLALTNKKIRDDINADIGNILKKIAENETDDEKKKLIIFFLKETEENKINRNIDFLNIYALDFLKTYRLLKGIVLPDRPLNEIIKISLSNENMLNLLKDLVTVFNIKSLDDAVYILGIMRKVVVTPENAIHIIDILNHISTNMRYTNSRALKQQFMKDILTFTDPQILQISQFISNVHIEDQFDALESFVKRGLTNEQIENIISKPNWDRRR